MTIELIPLCVLTGKPMPDPGKEVWIRCPGDKESAWTVIMKRSADERLDKVLA